MFLIFLHLKHIETSFLDYTWHEVSVCRKWIDCVNIFPRWHSSESNYRKLNHKECLFNKLFLLVFHHFLPLSLSRANLKNCYFCHLSTQTWLLVESSSFCLLFTSFIPSGFCWFLLFLAETDSVASTFPYRSKVSTSVWKMIYCWG